MNSNSNLKKIISDIELSGIQRPRLESENQPFKLFPYDFLISELSGNYGALFVRAIMNQLNINENHIFKWRLENKYQQYQIFNHYLPGRLPHTLSFSKLLKKRDGIQKIKALFKKGYFLKSTLGDASRSTNTWDKTAEFVGISKLTSVLANNYESYMLQKRLPIRSEFRVHTFSKEIIPALTYLVEGPMKTSNFESVENFIKEVLQNLPDSLLMGTLIAWDIALTDDNHYYIIEGNFTGFHPEYRRGFQTTGYVDDHRYGAIICAWVNFRADKQTSNCL